MESTPTRSTRPMLYVFSAVNGVTPVMTEAAWQMYCTLSDIMSLRAQQADIIINRAVATGVMTFVQTPAYNRAGARDRHYGTMHMLTQLALRCQVQHRSDDIYVPFSDPTRDQQDIETGYGFSILRWNQFLAQCLPAGANA